jgi:hypothetical protein
VRRLFNRYQEAVARADMCSDHDDNSATIKGEVEAAYQALITAPPLTNADLALQTLAHLSFARTTCGDDVAGDEASISRRLLHNWLHQWAFQPPAAGLIGR